MIITKELLERLEGQIGNDCTVCAIPDGSGLRLRAMTKKKETGDRIYQERLFSFDEMRKDTQMLQDHFALEAKGYFDNELSR